MAVSLVSDATYELPYEGAKEMMLEIAREYKNNEEVQNGIDSVYGAGSTAYMGEAIEAFYNK